MKRAKHRGAAHPRHRPRRRTSSEVHELGASIARIATHCTEADIVDPAPRDGAQDLGHGDGRLPDDGPHDRAGRAARRRRGSWRTPAPTASTSSTRPGAMTTPRRPRPGRRAQGRAAARRRRSASTPTTTSSLAVANSIGALEEGVDQVDGCSRGLGAGAGNCPTEVLVAVSEQAGLRRPASTRWRSWTSAEDVVAPIMPRPQLIDRSTPDARLRRRLLARSCSTPSGPRRGSASTPREILLELGRRKVVGGQEDMIVDVAMELARRS